MIAPPAYPDAVRDAFARAAAARRALGDARASGAAVQVALSEGVTDRQSFAVVALPDSDGPGHGYAAAGIAWRLRGPVFDVAARGHAPHRRDRSRTRSTARRSLTPLEGLSRMEVVGEQVRRAAEDSRRALEEGRWQPRWVLAHNDLWLGNFLFRAIRGRGRPRLRGDRLGRIAGCAAIPAYDFF